MRVLAAFIFTIAVLLTRVGHAGDPFQRTISVPDDVSVYVHVRDAGAIRATLADRPIAQSFKHLLSSAQVAGIWMQLSQQVGVDSDELFDRYLGDAFTFVARNDMSEWSIVLDVAPAASRDLLKSLNARLLGDRSNAALYDVPEYAIRIAVPKGKLVIGPSDHTKLFNQMVDRLNAPARKPLAQTDAMKRVRKSLGEGQVGLYLRNAPLMGGWSAVALDFKGSNVSARYAGEFDNPPFMTAPPVGEWDASIVKEFDKAALAAVAGPTDIDSGLGVEQFLHAVTGEGLVSEEMRGRLGEYRILLIGERDERLREPRGDDLTPTLALVFKVDPHTLPPPDPGQAWNGENLDDMMTNAAPAAKALRVTIMEVEAMLDGRMSRLPGQIKAALPQIVLTTPNLDAFETGEMRMIDLKPLGEGLFNSQWPFSRDLAVCWKVVDGPGGVYWVCATDQLHLRDVADQLQKPRTAKPDCGCYTNSGRINGQRLGRHLRSFSENFDVIFEVQDKDAFASKIVELAVFAEGIQDCCWKSRRPTANSLNVDVEIVLSPSESSQ